MQTRCQKVSVLRSASFKHNTHARRNHIVSHRSLSNGTHFARRDLSAAISFSHCCICVCCAEWKLKHIRGRCFWTDAERCAKYKTSVHHPLHWSARDQKELERQKKSTNAAVSAQKHRADQRIMLQNFSLHMPEKDHMCCANDVTV